VRRRRWSIRGTTLLDDGSVLITGGSFASNYSMLFLQSALADEPSHGTR
jgi:hypothetical protein